MKQFISFTGSWNPVRFVFTMLLVGMSISFESCSNQKADLLEIKPKEQISTKSARGYAVFENMAELERLTQIEARYVFGSHVTSTVKNVTYMETATSVVAFISYETNEGDSKNYALSYAVGAEDTISGPKYKIRCEGNCKVGGGGCIVDGTIKGDTVSFTCGCEGCTAVVEYMP